MSQKDYVQRIPEYLSEHFNKTLLGRLKLKLCKYIGGDNKCLPSDQSIRHFIIDQYRSRAEVGKLFGVLLAIKRSFLGRYNQLREPSDLLQLLLALEENPLEEAYFLEIIGCTETMPETLGALVYCEELSDGGYVYTVTLIDEGGFPNLLAGRAEIRANKAAPEPFFGLLGQEGYIHYGLNDYRDNPVAVLMTKVLNYIEQNRLEKFVQLTELGNYHLIEQFDTTPPIDKRLDELLRLVFCNELLCTEAEIELSLVKPYSLDFCISYPLDVVDEIALKAKRGSTSSLLVYWYNNSFIMSDDYAYYLAYRKLGYQKVPAIIIGPYPKEVVKPIRIGGTELVPPILISRSSDYSSLSLELQDYILEQRLQAKPLSDTITNLYSLFLFLAKLIQAPYTKEKQLHKFLLKNPIAIDPYNLRVKTEVRLGKVYRIDLVIQYEFTDKRVMLIELERANLPIFTKRGRLRAKVTDAIQQVEDWLRWWRENPSEIPKPLDSSMPAEGLVVIGRSFNMDEDAKRRLLNLNHNRKVKAITYDDLLDRLRNLIGALESTERS
ncbi:DUF4263 domain-containing protein [Pelotomaculum terephthalicicum JT]|uniref:Shedu anti-phage system protein SduA domain-containing protein n=1 Tax=Pelotomaculum terephthalicicum TaxID=206393 RepID=UPI001F04DCF6|nr:Shedu anti-phage system protein SduA domain-containing protein [Pelotomaculum terephthalicicum]MCG9967419.1 DUF4263 domain-containing protein [Pelotomaculum terephthalicicum JT]